MQTVKLPSSYRIIKLIYCAKFRGLLSVESMVSMESQPQNSGLMDNQKFHTYMFVLLLYVQSQQLWSWQDSQFT